jgi:hypothetical protein
LAVIVPKRPILWQVVLWSTLCLMVAIDCLGLWLYTGHDTPTALDVLVLFVLTVAQVILALAILFWWKRRRLRPLLATLTPTDLRITQSEMRAAATNAMSSKQLVITAWRASLPQLPCWSTPLFNSRGAGRPACYGSRGASSS